MSSKSGVENPLLHPLLFLYQILQWLISLALAPKPPKDGVSSNRPRIAIIGAGLTGVTAAAHCAGHGFDVQIFEAEDEEAVGGIWTRVNSTSGLQIHSLMYRFHPAVNWQKGYPNKEQIVQQIRHLWKLYKLDKHTKFNYKVEKVYQDNQGRWIINDPSNGRFAGLIAAIGTCGPPKMAKIDNAENFQGEIVHSSKLDNVDAKGKKLAIIGGGASAIEALEFGIAKGAAQISILSRSDKWIIPRNIFVDALLSMNIFGHETSLSWIPETLLRRLFYRDMADIAPSDVGLFTDTPMVNSDIMQQLRDGKAQWIRGDIEGFTEHGVHVNQRAQGVPKGGPGKDKVVDADIVVLATGFKRPSLSFLPQDCFEDPYCPPNWYLQTFPPPHPSLSAINCTYVAAIGTVGNWHIGIYTRIMLMFITDPLARPSPFWMRRWIGLTRFLKSYSPTPAFDFFTYLELIWWFVFCVSINPFRWKWALFVLFGVGFDLPNNLTELEKRVLKTDGYHKVDQGRSF
ncbi:flavin-binding monooxygenase-like protein [Beauveria brongniartii RCEF 3172]|uniref:Flavin-binding monooxygenase-like protein n=1 Tax=Beauveria brongniartii RCEF 3172 TaxID=1081107 RepID=A0A167GJR6_9HYPO|nr:flavin-binding monooxygenase-like protein [Beauveria brongniartii RCEF 3172]